MTRFGMGYDVHRLVEGRKLILGGVEIPWEKGLLGHSDADVLLLYGPDASPEAVCRQVQLFTARGLRVLAQQKRPEHGLFGRVVELGKGEPGC